VARKSNLISILQVDEHLIALLRVRRSPRGVDVAAWEQERGDWSQTDGSLGKALKEFAARHKVARDEVYTVLPRHDMTARILDLPSQDPGEISGMIRLSAEEYVPFPPEQLVIDQCILQRLPEGSSRVLAIFAHRDVVNAHVALLHGAGIDPEKILVSTACLASAALAADPGPEGRYALVHLASGGIEALVLDGNRLEYGRAVATAQDWAGLAGGDTDALEELGVEVRASLSAYRRESEDGLGVEQVFLCSEFADVQGAAENLSEATGYECGRADFASALLSRKGAVLPGLPLVSLGAALAAQDRAMVAMNLVPGSLTAQREMAQFRRRAVAVGGVAVALLLSALSLLWVARHQRQVYIAELGKQIAAVKPLADEVVVKQRNLMVLQQRVDRSGAALELLSRASRLTPSEGLGFLKFRYQRGLEARIEGQAVDPVLVTRFSEALRAEGEANQPLFKDARTGPTRQVVMHGQTVEQFEIEIPFPQTDIPEEEAGLE
jgi:hypothetical protein